MGKRLGVPYMGSKNTIAKKIINKLPKARHFYDLFAGGCAVTQAALESGKYESITANDTQDAPRLFADAIAGKFKNEKRWISREDFFALKDKEPYVKYCWSFGNNGQNYLYNRETEGLRKLQWQMCFADTPYERKLFMRKMFTYIYNMGLLLCIPNVARGEAISEKMIDTCKMVAEGNTEGFESIQTLQQLQSLERLQSLQRLAAGESGAGELFEARSVSFEVRKGDYRDVHIEQDSVIYCDIPYKGTAGYIDRHKGDGFDYDAFYDWCEAQTVPVFISEYDMPADRFEVVAEWAKLCTLCATDNRRQVTERLYRPRKGGGA